MKRRQLLMGLTSAVAISGLTAGAASAGILDNLRTAIVGHAKDAKGRLVASDSFVAGPIIKEGTFNEEAEGQDLAHWAKGKVVIIESEGKQYIQLFSDFNSGPLPDGYVYVSGTATNIQTESDFYSSKQVELGPLKQGKGAHFYEIPEGITVVSFTIMCKAFKEYIGSADLK